MGFLSWLLPDWAWPLVLAPGRHFTSSARGRPLSQLHAHLDSEGSIVPHECFMCDSKGATGAVRKVLGGERGYGQSQIRPASRIPPNAIKGIIALS